MVKARKDKRKVKMKKAVIFFPPNNNQFGNKWKREAY